MGPDSARGWNERRAPEWSAALVFVPIAAGLYALIGHHYDRTIEAKRQSAGLQNRIIEAALRHQMMDRDPGMLAAILDEIAAQPEVQSAQILTHLGEVRVASPVRTPRATGHPSRAGGAAPAS